MRSEDGERLQAGVDGKRKGERRGGGPWRGRKVEAGLVEGMNGGDGGAAIRAAAAAAAGRRHADEKRTRQGEAVVPAASTAAAR